MTIKIEGNKVVVVSKTNIHHVISKDKSIKANQMGECSLCGDVLLYYQAINDSFACSIGSMKATKKYRRKMIENRIKENDPYLSVPSYTI